MKTILLPMLVSCALLTSTKALVDVKDRIKDRVIHIETLLKRGRWLWQNDNSDADGAKYLWIDELAERDTYYQPRVQFQTSVCGNYLCLESLALRDYYLTAGFPAGATKYTVKLERSTYTQENNRYHWKFLCEDETLKKCKVVPIRFESKGYLMVADNWGHEEGYAGGHYDATLGKDETKAYFRIHAPNPTDGLTEIYKNTNKGSIDQLAKYITSIGVSQTHETTQSISSTTSIEIGGAFKAFSASVSTTIEKSWATTESSTYEQSKTVEHDITIPARTTVTLYQLIGHYAGEFDVGDDVYEIKEESLDTRTTRRHWVRYIRGRKQEMQSAL